MRTKNKYRILALILLIMAVIAMYTGCSTTPDQTQIIITGIRVLASEGTTIDLLRTPTDRPYFVAASGILSGISSNNITVIDIKNALSAVNVGGNNSAIVAVSIKNALDLIDAQVGTNQLATANIYVTPLQQGIQAGLDATK